MPYIILSCSFQTGSTFWCVFLDNNNRTGARGSHCWITTVLLCSSWYGPLFSRYFFEKHEVLFQNYKSRSTLVHLTFSGVRVTPSLVLCICFVDRCLFFCTFSFVHCVVCSSLIYTFCLPLWFLQTFFYSTLFLIQFVIFDPKHRVIW